MKVNTKDIEWLLENETQYRISKEANVHQSILSGLKNGNRKMENLTVMIGDRLTTYAGKLKKQKNKK
nr:MAG TPA: DNA-binding protein [Caudoviricetes sp.]